MSNEIDDYDDHECTIVWITDFIDCVFSEAKKHPIATQQTESNSLICSRSIIQELLLLIEPTLTTEELIDVGSSIGRVLVHEDDQIELIPNYNVYHRYDEIERT